MRDPGGSTISRIGYDRVSITDKDAQLQLDALEDCDWVFTDHARGTVASRSQLDAMLDHLRSGDTVTIWKFDRLGGMRCFPLDGGVC